MSSNDLIKSIIPSSSSYPGSALEEVVANSICRELDDMDENRITELYESFFERTATGQDLDRLGSTYGIEREGESDEEYRKRIIFHADKMISLQDLIDVGCSVYEYTPEFNLNNTLLSNNITEINHIIIVCPNQRIYDLVNRNLFINAEVVLDGN